MSGNYKINLTESLTWKRKSGEGRQGKQGVETEGENDSVQDDSRENKLKENEMKRDRAMIGTYYI